mmetsp:Transcript_27838/g.64204  ORF Transcript_27838/g.64204 Transcript_27838/m.64204 type:complete len:316 (-) Transcript_27838:1752-2699(-)
MNSGLLSESKARCARNRSEPTIRTTSLPSPDSSRCLSSGSVADLARTTELRVLTPGERTGGGSEAARVNSPRLPVVHLAASLVAGNTVARGDVPTSTVLSNHAICAAASPWPPCFPARILSTVAVRRVRRVPSPRAACASSTQASMNAAVVGLSGSAEAAANTGATVDPAATQAGMVLPSPTQLTMPWLKQVPYRRTRRLAVLPLITSMRSRRVKREGGTSAAAVPHGSAIISAALAPFPGPTAASTAEGDGNGRWVNQVSVSSSASPPWAATNTNKVSAVRACCVSTCLTTAGFTSPPSYRTSRGSEEDKTSAK